VKNGREITKARKWFFSRVFAASPLRMLTDLVEEKIRVFVFSWRGFDREV
jgi:hypothetical protein